MARAVITGASSGLGEVFARRLAARGYSLTLAARRRERLESLAAEIRLQHPVEVEVVPADLSADAGIEAFAARVAAMNDLEILVNNAGFGTRGRFWETAWGPQDAMHRLHVLATLRLTRAALEAMLPHDRGAVINVSSVAGFFRSAGNVSYCATKAWMNSFCEGVWLELESVGSRVQIQALCPGFTYTEFHDAMGVDRAKIAKPLWMTAEFVVDESLKALEKRQLFVIPGRKYRWGVALASLLPVSWRLALEGKSPHRKGREQVEARMQSS
jgi:short-subunit dehydrogenase